MPSAEPRTAFRFSYLILGVSIVTAVGSYAYSAWSTSQREKALRPRPAVDRLVKGLRTYHHRFGSFPDTLVELQTKVWHDRRELRFGDNGRSLIFANYYYLYTQIESGACTVWAIPINSRRDDGTTFFLSLTPNAARRWKGAPLSLEDVRRLHSLPDPAQLAVLGLTELPTAAQKLRTSAKSPAQDSVKE